MRYAFAFNVWKDIARFPWLKFDIVLVAEATATLYSERWNLHKLGYYNFTMRLGLLEMILSECDIDCECRESKIAWVSERLKMTTTKGYNVNIVCIKYIWPDKKKSMLRSPSIYILINNIGLQSLLKSHNFKYY